MAKIECEQLRDYNDNRHYSRILPPIALLIPLLAYAELGNAYRESIPVVPDYDEAAAICIEEAWDKVNKTGTDINFSMSKSEIETCAATSIEAAELDREKYLENDDVWQRLNPVGGIAAALVTLLFMGWGASHAVKNHSLRKKFPGIKDEAKLYRKGKHPAQMEQREIADEAPEI